LIPGRQFTDARSRLGIWRNSSRETVITFWIVYSKPPFGGPEYVLQYLGRYTHRVAISNHRLIALADGQVTQSLRKSGRSQAAKNLDG
jgi:hypothetical protein